MIRLGSRTLRKLWIAILVGGTIHTALHGAEEEPLPALEPEEEKVPAWDLTANLKAGAGYKSNVALSNFNRESSAFAGVDLDAFVFRSPIYDPWEVGWLVTGEDRRFWQSDTVKKEQLFLTSLDVKREVADRWKIGGNALYLYYDQVLDASATEGVPLRIQAKFQKIALGPTVRFDLTDRRRFEFRAAGSRNLFDRPFDDYWQEDGRLLYGQKFAERSEFTLSAEFRYRDYDTRPRPGGSPGETVNITQKEIEATVRHSWDEKEHWKSRLRAGFELNEDDGNGFFDYRKWRVAHEMSFASGRFEAILDAKLQHYRYSRSVFAGSERLNRTEVIASLRVEQGLTKHLKLFAEVMQEWSLSSDPFERYKATTAWGGLDWQIR